MYAEIIKNEFVKTLKETLSRFGEELKVNPGFVQVFFGSDANGENTYQIFHNYKPYKVIGFKNNGIVKGKLDMSGKSLIVPPSILQVLQTLEEENGLQAHQAGIMVINTPKMKDDEVEHAFTYYLYDGLKPVKEISANDLFSKIKIG